MKKKAVCKTLSFISLVSFNYISSMQSVIEIHTTKECRFTKEIIIPSIGKPSCVAFINNDIIFLNGTKGYAIYNRYTKKLLLHQQREYGYLDIVVNNERTQYAISADKNLTVYDTQTTKQLWQKKTKNLYTPITFDPANRIISYIPNSKIFSIFTNQSDEIDTLTLPTKTGPIYCHPKRFELLYSQGSSLNIAKFFENTNVNILHNKHHKKSSSTQIIGGIYNNDGTIIAVNDKNHGCFIHNNNPPYTILNHYHQVINDNPSNIFGQAHYISMIFHPNNTLALLTHNNTLEYRKSTTGKLLKQNFLNTFDTLQVNGSMQKKLSFSPDGKYIIVALKNKFLMLFTPFEALYSSEIFQNLSIRYYLLCKYTDISLIPDIRRKIFFHYIDQLEKLPSIT